VEAEVAPTLKAVVKEETARVPVAASAVEGDGTPSKDGSEVAVASSAQTGKTRFTAKNLARRARRASKDDKYAASRKHPALVVAAKVALPEEGEEVPVAGISTAGPVKEWRRAQSQAEPPAKTVNSTTARRVR